MSTLCYAEFAARVPRAGSAYVYSYVTVGELMAFVIGWNLLLEYIIALLAVGVRESTHFNNIFTGVNICVIVYVVICGAFKAHLHNWQLPPSQIPKKGAGTGGFLPFGFSGMMSGAATCFYAYVGFDCIATTGEETKNPEKSIPIAVVSALLVILVSYCSVASVVTLMCPYYLIDVNTPLPFVFQYVGWDLARYIIAIGAMCGLSTRYETDDNMPKTVKGDKHVEVKGDDSPIKLRYLLFPPVTSNPSPVTSAVAKTCVASLFYLSAGKSEAKGVNPDSKSGVEPLRRLNGILVTFRQLLHPGPSPAVLTLSCHWTRRIRTRE
ncbi:hypothetical protein ACOMHN_010627 [Nucella lapillus]